MYSYLKFAKHTLIIGAINALGIVQSLVFLPVITKILGAQDYGIWSQIKVTMSLIVPLTFLGLSTSLGRFLPGEKDNKKIQEGVYSSMVIVSVVTLVLALFMIIFSGLVANLFRFDQVFVKILSLAIILESLSAILLTVIISRREIEKYFWFAVSKMFWETGLIIGAILLGYGLYGAVFCFLFIRIIIFLILLFYIVKKIGIKFPDFSLLREYFRFGLPTVTNGISYWVVTSVDRYVIGFFLGIVFVGYYAPAYSLGTLLVFFTIPMMSMLDVVLPKFFDENNIYEVKNYLSLSLKYFLLVMIPAVFGLSILSHRLLILLSTEEIALNAYLVIPVISMSMLLYGITCFFSQVLVLVKKTKIIAIIWAIAALVNLGLNLIFVPKFGIIAAAIVTLVSYLCALFSMWRFAFKEFQFHISWVFVGKSIIASVPMVLFIRWFNPLAVFNVISSIILGIIIYISLILLFKAVGKKEIDFFKKLIYEMVFSNK